MFVHRVVICHDGGQHQDQRSGPRQGGERGDADQERYEVKSRQERLRPVERP